MLYKSSMEKLKRFALPVAGPSIDEWQQHAEGFDEYQWEHPDGSRIVYSPIGDNEAAIAFQLVMPDGSASSHTTVEDAKEAHADGGEASNFNADESIGIDGIKMRKGV